MVALVLRYSHLLWELYDSMNTQPQIYNLYSTFSGYPLKLQIEGCSHCELQNLDSLLHTKKLTQLSWDDLQLFILKIMTTFGDVGDFKHFLPRIFELYVTDYWNAPCDFGLFLAKLEYSGWATWPENEREVVLRLYENWMLQLKGSSLAADKELLEDIVADIEYYEVKLAV